ncbi:MAG: hypothetical protein JW703_01780 [Candidatus Diapherotrites archaeon]|nr:hypothetical protein [Candidatus Diapherotrites archaeon]
MGETLVRFEGAQEAIIERLIGIGLFKTKSEVIRAGIIGLGKEYKVIDEIKQIEDELAVKKMQKIFNEVDSGKRKLFTEEEVKKKYGFK